MLGYATLRVIWWVLLGVLLIGFAVTDGWDLGACALLPFIARTDGERRLTINAVAPTWEGNQVWFILGGGAIFAAWPFVYAVSFSGFYLAMFLVLASLILRPVGFKYRSKRPQRAWRSRWDWALFVGGFVPSLVFGVAVGNVLSGVPFHFDDDLRIFYDGSFLGLFTPFSLLCGLLSVAMLTMHGAAFVSTKVERGRVHDRASAFGRMAAVATIVLFAVGGIFIAFGHLGYAMVNLVDPAGPSNPLRATVHHAAGAWLRNYATYPWNALAPLLGLGGAMIAFLGFSRRADGLTLLGSAGSVAGIIATVGVSMFPFILPSSTDAHASLLVWNASSSRGTLFTMLIVTVIFLPIILIYTSWVYRVLFGRITQTEIAASPDFY